MSLLNYEALSCPKRWQNFLNLFQSCEGRKSFDKRTSFLPAFVGRYLCLEPLSRLLCLSMRLAWSVTSALAGPKGFASDDVKLVLNNNSVLGYRHTHVHKDWKIFWRTQALLHDWSLLRPALLWASEDQSEFFLLPSPAECFILTTNLETGRESCFFSGASIARRSQRCTHADTSKFSSGSSTSRLWFNVCRQVGSPEWAGKRTLTYVSSEQETDCLHILHMLGVGNVLSTANLLVFSFEKLCGNRKQHEPQYLLHGEHENKG